MLGSSSRTLIDISFKNVLPKEWRDIYVLNQFSWDHNQRPNVFVKYADNRVAFAQKESTSRVIFAVDQ